MAKKIKIKSNVNSGFKIDGVLILPGVGLYQLDYKAKHIAYQLGILKSEGLIDFDNIIKVDTKSLPFEEEVKTDDDVKPPRKKVKRTRKK